MGDLVLTASLRRRLIAADREEMRTSGDDASHDRLLEALGKVDDGTIIPRIDLSEIETAEDELNLDDLGFIDLTVDFYGLDS